ncbi:MAG: tRNA adenosine(34) deaminase TadA [Candidatus Sericytochromatia bacterium]|nr:tRNA adenosine(34) deaminase TadA [Candidatus Sericytochromatia bacterium]
MAERHATYMDLAIAEAQQAARVGDVPVGAVLVHAGEVVGRGHNSREHRHDPVGHAEINAIRQAARRLGRWRLTGCVLYVTLEPCPMCAAALVQARLPLLVYGANDAKLGAAGSRYNLVQDPHLHHHVEVIAGVRETQCEVLLRDFFRRHRGDAEGFFPAPDGPG